MINISKKAYTLLEILVVLIIISIGTGLSIATITSFRNTLVINDKGIVLSSEIRSFQSDATSNKIYSNSTNIQNWKSPFIYQIKISENSLQKNACLANDDFTFTNQANPLCNQVSKIDITDQPDLQIDITNAKSCDEIDFFGGTGSIKLFKSNLVVASCCIYLKNVKSNDKRYIYLDSKSRTVDLINDSSNYCTQ